MNQFVLHQLVLSCVFVIPSLKNVDARQSKRGLLAAENALQLARLYDASRPCFLCHSLIVRKHKQVSATGAWKAIRQRVPKLEMKLLEPVIHTDSASFFCTSD